MRRAVSLLLATLPLLCSCAYQDSRTAMNAEQSVIGKSAADLDMCAGLPTKTERIDSNTELRSYERSESTNSGLNLTFPVIGGGLNIGNGGYCHATFKLVDGHVRALSYAGDTDIAGAKEAICAPIVRTCVAQFTPEPASKGVTQAAR